ncbi:MAG: hypothetical protein H6619_06065, partial [Deltaproteobacteria bacterium]|nr:hypothetical protein [Deltaproteobacteria bacterium]
MSSLVTDLASGLPSTLFTPHHQDRHDSHELVLGLSRADLPPTHEVKAGLLEVGTHSLYEPREIEPDQLPDAISRIRDGRSFVHIEGAVAIQYVDPSGGVTKLSGNDLAIGEAHFPLYYGDVVRRPDQCSRDKNSGISFFSLSELAHNSRYIDGACLGIRMGDEVKLHRARVLENNGTRTVIVPIA